jgi:chromatin remodeling complex protein RSC6
MEGEPQSAEPPTHVVFNPMSLLLPPACCSAAKDAAVTAVKRAKRVLSPEAAAAAKARLLSPVKVTPALATLLGKPADVALPRPEITKQVWAYIKSNKLQENKLIKPDAGLAGIVGSEPLSFLALPGKLSLHVEPFGQKKPRAATPKKAKAAAAPEPEHK